MDTYQKWIQSEKEWINTYCRKIRRQALCITAPLVLAGSAVLFGVLSALGDGGTEGLLYGAFGGFLLGIAICGIYLLILLPSLRPGRYARKIEKSVRRLSLSGPEKEQLAQEMLAADETHKVSYTIVGPGSKGTPGRFVLTPHYAFLEGSVPYSILVRLSDIAWIRKGEERKIATERRAKTRAIYKYTLYTIGFYRKDGSQKDFADAGLPDEAFGFFDVKVREQVAELLRETDIAMK